MGQEATAMEMDRTGKHTGDGGLPDAELAELPDVNINLEAALDGLDAPGAPDALGPSRAGRARRAREIARVRWLVLGAALVAVPVLFLAIPRAPGRGVDWDGIGAAIWAEAQSTVQPYEKLERVIGTEKAAPGSERPMWIGDNATHCWVCYALYSPAKSGSETYMAYAADVWGFWDKASRTACAVRQKAYEIYRQIGLAKLNRSVWGEIDFTPIPWWEQRDPYAFEDTHGPEGGSPAEVDATKPAPNQTRR